MARKAHLKELWVSGCPAWNLHRAGGGERELVDKSAAHSPQRRLCLVERLGAGGSSGVERVARVRDQAAVTVGPQSAGVAPVHQVVEGLPRRGSGT